MKKPWEALLATSAIVSIAFGGVALTSLSAAAVEAPEPAPVTSTDAVDDGAPVESTDPAASEPVADGSPSEAEPTVDDAAAEPSAPGAGGTPSADAAQEAATEPLALAAAPSAPTISSPADGVSLEVTVDQGATVGDTPVVFTGSGQPGAVVTLVFVRDDAAVDLSSEPDVQVVVDSAGSWSTSVGLESGRWSTSATQQMVDADGVPTSDPSPVSTAVGFEAISQVLPWASVEPNADRTYVADSGVEGRSVAIVPIYGNAGTIFTIEIAVLSEDGSEEFATYSTPSRPDNSYYVEIPLPVGQWRVAVQQVSYSYPTHPEIKTMSSTPTISPVITVLPAGSADALPPVITSPTDGSTVTGSRVDADGSSLTVEGTGTPGYSVYLSATTQGENDDLYEAFWDEGIVVGDDGRWSYTSAQVPAGRYGLTAYQRASGIENAVFSSASATVTVDLVLPVAPVSPVSSTTTASSTTPSTSLAYTGSAGTGATGLVAVMAVLAGAGTLLVARQRARRAARSSAS